MMVKKITLYLLLSILFYPNSTQAQTPEDQVTTLDWNPAGTQIVVGYESSPAQVLDAATLQPVFTTPLPNARKIVSWSPNGKYIAFHDTAINDGTPEVFIFDMVSQQIIQSFEITHSYDISAIVWNPHGTRMAIAVQRYSGLVAVYDLEIWDTLAWQLETVLHHRYLDAISSASWSANGDQLATATYDGVITVWDGNSFGQKKVIQTYPSIYSMSWSPEANQIATGSGNGIMALWSASDGKLNSFITVGDFRHIVMTTDWNPIDDRIATISTGRLQVWGVSTGARLLDIYDSDRLIYTEKWSPNGIQLAYAGQGTAVNIITPPVSLPAP